MESIKELLVMIAPLVAGFITSTLLPALISKWSVGKLKNKLDEVDKSKTDKEIIQRLDRIENEILEIRGKRK